MPKKPVGKEVSSTSQPDARFSRVISKKTTVKKTTTTNKPEPVKPINTIETDDRFA